MIIGMIYGVILVIFIMFFAELLFKMIKIEEKMQGSGGEEE